LLVAFFIRYITVNKHEQVAQSCGIVVEKFDVTAGFSELKNLLALMGPET
jgi:hypothetical protein